MRNWLTTELSRSKSCFWNWVCLEGFSWNYITVSLIHQHNCWQLMVMSLKVVSFPYVSWLVVQGLLRQTAHNAKDGQILGPCCSENINLQRFLKDRGSMSQNIEILRHLSPTAFLHGQCQLWWFIHQPMMLLSICPPPFVPPATMLTDSICLGLPWQPNITRDQAE